MKNMIFLIVLLGLTLILVFVIQPKTANYSVSFSLNNSNFTYESRNHSLLVFENETHVVPANITEEAGLLTINDTIKGIENAYFDKNVTVYGLTDMEGGAYVNNTLQTGIIITGDGTQTAMSIIQIAANIFQIDADGCVHIDGYTGACIGNIRFRVENRRDAVLTGHLSVGTETVSHTVEVNGTMNVSDNISTHMICLNESGCFTNFSSMGVGNVTGSGTSNYIPKWYNASQLTNSIMNDSGTLVTVIGNLNVTNETEIGDDINFGTQNLASGVARLLMRFYVNKSGNPDNDGFRLVWNGSYINTNNDYLVFQKTDGNDPEPDGGIAFENVNYTGGIIKTLIMTGSGKVGIGLYNSTPTQKLDVNGSANISGNVTASWFFGLFNFTVNNAFLSFNGSYLDFNQSVLSTYANQTYVDTNINNNMSVASINITQVNTSLNNEIAYRIANDSAIAQNVSSMNNSLNSEIANRIGNDSAIAQNVTSVNTTVNAIIINKSGTGNCPDGYVVQNLTSGAPQCVSTLSTTYYPNTTVTTGGTNTTSNITLMWYYDDATYNISEGSGSNPMTVYMNFTNVTTFSEWVIREYYTGSSAHNIQFELYDYPTATWQQYYGIVGQSGFTIVTIPVYDSSNHIQSGIVQTRLNHVENGNPSHRLYIDFTWLIDGNNVGASTNLAGYAKYNFTSNNFNGSGNFTTTGNVIAQNIFGNLNGSDIRYGIVNVSHGGTGTTEQFTNGSIIFASGNGSYAQNNTNLTWNNSKGLFYIKGVLSIGTKNPYGISDIAASGIKFQFEGPNGQYFVLNDSYNYASLRNAFMLGVDENASAKGHLRFFRRSDDDTDWLEALQISRVTGYTGLGRITPNVQLTVNGSIRATGNISIEQNATAVWFLGLFNFATNTTFFSFNGSYLDANLSGWSNYFYNKTSNINASGYNISADNATLMNLNVTQNLTVIGNISSLAYSVKYNTNTAHTLSNTVVTIIDFEDKVYDEKGLVTTGVAWKYTVQKAGVYLVCSRVTTTAAAGWDSGELLVTYLYKNGVGGSVIGTTYNYLTHSYYVAAAGCVSERAVSGDYFDVRAYQNTGGSQTTDTNAQIEYITIDRVGD